MITDCVNLNLAKNDSKFITPGSRSQATTKITPIKKYEQRLLSYTPSNKKDYSFKESMEDLSDRMIHNNIQVLTAKESRHAAKPVRILLVNASAHDRKAYRSALQHRALFNVEILEAESGSNGLQIAKHHATDCILLSDTIADMNSTEFLTCLWTESGARSTPVLHITETTSSLPLDKTIEPGIHDCLIKDQPGHYLALLPITIKCMLNGHYALKEKYRTEVMYRALIEHIQAITYVVSLDHGNHMVYVSPQIEELGFSSNMWMNYPAFRFQHVHEEDRNSAESAFIHSCRTGEDFCCDYRLCCSDGTVRWFRDKANVVKDYNGQALFFHGIMMDISNIKAMEDELTVHRHYIGRQVEVRTEEMERRLAVMESCNAALSDQLDRLYETQTKLEYTLYRNQSIIQTLDMSVIMLDEDDWITEMNEQALALLGWDPNSAIDHKINEILHLSGTNFQSIQQALSICEKQANKSAYFTKLLLRYLDGRMIFVNLRLIKLNKGCVLILTKHSKSKQ